MNFFDSLRIGASGLTTQRFRMGLISSNMANANTTRTAEGGPYKRKDAIVAATPLEKSFEQELDSQMDEKMSEVSVIGVATSDRAPIVKYDPGHPDANEAGYVAYPNVNLVEEMVNMMSAARSYEANVTAISTTKNMAMKALEIGR
jgi:flagellar basal-body rod protein FlgC